MEVALKNTVIAESYGLTLKSFFKDYFKYSDDMYIIPFDQINRCKRQISDFIKNDCNDDSICTKHPSCHGHQFLQFLAMMYQFQRRCIFKKNMFFRYFLFSHFRTNSGKIKSWRVMGIFKEELNNMTYSQKLSFLKIINVRRYR